MESEKFFQPPPEKAIRQVMETIHSETQREILKKFPEAEKMPGLLEHLERVFKAEITKRDLESISTHTNGVYVSAYLYRVKFCLGNLRQQIIENSVVGVLKNEKIFGGGEKIFCSFLLQAGQEKPGVDNPNLRFKEVKIAEINNDEIVVQALPQEGNPTLIKFS